MSFRYPKGFSDICYGLKSIPMNPLCRQQIHLPLHSGIVEFHITSFDILPKTHCIDEFPTNSKPSSHSNVTITPNGNVIFPPELVIADPLYGIPGSSQEPAVTYSIEQIHD